MSGDKLCESVALTRRRRNSRAVSNCQIINNKTESSQEGLKTRNEKLDRGN